MNSLTAFFAVTMFTLTLAEPPSPYSYNRPSTGLGGGGGGGFGGFSSFGSSGSGFSSFGGGSGGGFQSNEGANVDPQLLEQVRQILLREESQSGSGSVGTPSGSYGPPSTSYGVPSQPQARVVAIQLENTIPSIQVASFSQQSYAQTPSSSYGAPSAPSQSYGTPSFSPPAPQYSPPAQQYSPPAPQYSAPPSQSYGAPQGPY